MAVLDLTTQTRIGASESMQAKDVLRPYQAELTTDAMSALDQGGSVLLQLPTGGGKTHIAVEVAKLCIERGERVWFVCHRREIMKQTSASFAAAGVDHGILLGWRQLKRRSVVQVCSVGALARRFEDLEAPHLVIWDECHHVPARTWAEVKRQLASARHLGLSATPDRLDGKGLRSAFNRLICGPDTRALIEQGHLSPYRLFGPTLPDMRGVGLKMGDYDKGDVEREMTKPVLVGDVVEHYKRLAPGSRAIAFTCSVRASRALVERLRGAGIAAEHVDATTSIQARDAAIEALRSGAIKVLSNVELFTEGFDVPAIEAVILLRPTKSLALYRQMVGRALRVAPGKTATVILDHAGLTYEHGLPDDEIDWTLDGFVRPGSRGRSGGRGPRPRRCPTCSAIHAWSAECPECGHVYGPQDRTIDEVYGDLTEIGRMSGNKHPKGYAPGTFESRADFAKRVGKPRGRITKWCAKGLPRGPNGWIEVEPALAWVERWSEARARKPDAPEVRRRYLGDTVAEFAARVGRKLSTIERWKRERGLPRFDDGSINVQAALSWMEETRLVSGGYGPAPLGCEALKAFCRRVGVSETGGGRSLLRRGIPVRPDGFVDIEAATAWVRAHGVLRSRGRRLQVDVVVDPPP